MYTHTYNYEEYTKAFEKKMRNQHKVPNFKRFSYTTTFCSIDMALVNFGHFE